MFNDCKILSRERIIIRTSWLGIIVNVLIAAIKVVLGVLASSIAIISEGVNNAADAISSVLTLIGTRLAQKRPDKTHPFGYGRIEYLTGLVISVIILVSGTEMMISSIKLIFSPTELSISYLSLIIIAFSAVVKFILGAYTVKKGRETDSDALVGVGTECKSDCLVSTVTIISAVVFLAFGFSIDAYAGAITSAFIIWAGIGVLKKTVSEILGRPGDSALAIKLYKKIRSTKGIVAAADMTLHCYGPGAYSGSVNVEMHYKKTVGEIYGILHDLQLRIMHEHKVTMVFGVYAVDSDNEKIQNIRKTIAKFVNENNYIKNFHALYLEPITEKIYCDFIVDYALKDWNALKLEFETYMYKYYPKSAIELTVETEFV